jgi:hypothetical protein|tara:strand:+ start:134 stop:283 length:150 start_codon:yes stop_codon:yes gene_type:complete
MDEKDVIVNVTGVSGSIMANLEDSKADVDKRTSREDQERTSSEKTPDSN